MIAANAGPRRRVIIGRLLRGEFFKSRRRKQFLRANRAAKKRGASSDRHAIQKIAPCDLAIHSQFAILLLPAKFLVVHPGSPHPYPAEKYTAPPHLYP